MSWWPWAQVGEARKHAEEAQQRADEVEPLVRKIRDERRKNHFAEALRDAIRGIPDGGRKGRP